MNEHMNAKKPGGSRERRKWSLDVESDLHALDRIRSFIDDVCAALGDLRPAEERVAMIRIVATEIVTNIIRHAYEGKPGRPIRIEASAGRFALLLKFRDRGIAFDFEKAPDPVFDGSRESGFGLHIIRHTADTLRYSRDEDGVNCARVGFNLQRRGTE